MTKSKSIFLQKTSKEPWRLNTVPIGHRARRGILPQRRVALPVATSGTIARSLSKLCVNFDIWKRGMTMCKLLVAAVLTVIMLLPAQAVPLDSKAFSVDISLVVVSTNPLVLEGTTNLPDGMQLFALLFGYRHSECDGRQQCLDIVSQAGQGTTVVHGHFKLSLESVESAPPTAWQLFMTDSGAQPANVVAAIGEAGQHLLGLYTKRDFIPDANEPGGGYTVVGVDFNKVICAPPNGKGFIDPRWTPEAENILHACRRPSP